MAPAIEQKLRARGWGSVVIPPPGSTDTNTLRAAIRQVVRDHFLFLCADSGVLSLSLSGWGGGPVFFWLVCLRSHTTSLTIDCTYHRYREPETKGRREPDSTHRVSRQQEHARAGGPHRRRDAASPGVWSGIRRTHPTPATVRAHAGDGVGVQSV